MNEWIWYSLAHQDLPSFRVAGYKSYECLSEWLSGKLSETVEIMAIQNSTYPAITICPQYAVAYKRSRLDELGISGGDYRGGNFFGNRVALQLTKTRSRPKIPEVGPF